MPDAPETQQTDAKPVPAAQRDPRNTRPNFGDRMRDAGWDPAEVGDGGHGEQREGEPERAPAKKPTRKVAPQAAVAEPQEKPDPNEEGEPEEAPDEEETKPDQPKPKPAAAKKKGEELGGLGLLKKLAEEQGFVVEGDKIRTKERAEFRVFKDAAWERLKTAEKEAIGRIETAQKELDDRHKAVESLETAKKSRDHQALAKALGYENWDKLQEDVIAWNADPSYQERREMAEKIRAMEEREEREASERQQQAEQHQRNQMRAEYRSGLVAQMQQSRDPIIAAMHDDPLFVEAIMRIQAENADFQRNETVTPERALRMSVRGAPRTLLEDLQILHRRLSAALGGKATNGQQTAEEERPTPKPKPKIASGPRSAPSVPGKFESRLERMQHYSARLGEANERDRKTGSAY